MSFFEALLITLLGIGAVFFGLILTSFSIHLFGQLINRRKENPVQIEKTSEQVEQNMVYPVSPDIVAAVLTTLELEKKINLSYRTSRFTFKTQKGR